MCYKEFYIVKVTNNNQNFRQITISIDESISTDQFLVSNYSNTINEEIDFDTNEIKEYIVSSTYQKKYEIETTGLNDLDIRLFDINNNEIELINLNEPQNSSHIVFEMGCGEYYLIMKNCSDSSGTIHFNLKSRTSRYLSFNSNNDILLNTYNGINDYYYINERGPGFYKFIITGQTINNSDFLLASDSIKIYNTANKNEEDIIKKYNYLNYSNSASNKENENSIIVCLERNGYYYLDFNIMAYNLSSLSVEIINLSNTNINLFEINENLSSNLTLLSSDNVGDYFESFNLNQCGKFNFRIEYEGRENEEFLFVLAKKEYINNICNITTVYAVLINEDNFEEQFVSILTEGVYYIGYFNKIDACNLNVNVTRIITQSGSGALLVDPGERWDCGSQVNIIDGNFSKSYNQTFITIGFTRIIYMNEEYGISTSRLDFYWYSSNNNVATVTNYGTVLGRGYGNVKIMAVSKQDPSKVFIKSFNIIPDDGTGYMVVESNLNIKYSDTDNGTFHLNLENCLCPYPWFQYYTWEVNTSCQGDELFVSTNEWGDVNVSGPGSFDLIGYNYVYNTQYINIVVIIHINITNN